MRHLLTLSFCILLFACGTSKDRRGDGFNVFPVSQDRDLGHELSKELEGPNSEYKILDSASNADVYGYLYGIRDKLLATGIVKYAKEFPWRIRVIDDDSTVNAMCGPGGYIYVFTGIMHFLQNEAQLAGVLGHEIGHADRRHYTRLLTKMYGLSILSQVLTGNQTALHQVALGLTGLTFQRSHETESDKFAVDCLCKTDYDADAFAWFFEEASKGGTPPVFLSTHPSPDRRVETIKESAQFCGGTYTGEARHQAIVKKLR